MKFISVCLVSIIAVLFSSVVSAATVPISCQGFSNAFSINKLPNGQQVLMTNFIGNDFVMTGLSAGQYNIISTGSAMLAVGSSLVTAGSDGIIKGSITCPGYKYMVTQIQTTLSCAAVSAGASCYWYAIYNPNNYPGNPSNSYNAANAASYPQYGRCIAAAPSTATASNPAATVCMRKFNFVKTAPYSGANSGYHQQIQNGSAVELFPPD